MIEPMEPGIPATISRLRQAYLDGQTSPAEVIANIIERSAQLAEHNIWITPPSVEGTAPYLNNLANEDPAAKPLWGIPFAVKDNIDLADFATTAACPAYRYLPDHSASVVQRLIDAGAIPVGKTNLDQFATGLVGTRSPYGVTTHPERADYISGGSSSGSSVAVSCGLACFALGTDTAGSGRVPAALNGLVGLKPTRGLLSNYGVVPACRSIDCVSIFTHTVHDAALVAAAAAGLDQQDPYSVANPYPNQFEHFGRWPSHLTLGVIETSQLEFFGNDEFARAYDQSLTALREAGIELVNIDFAPFVQAAEQLYKGPWVTERFLVIEALLRDNPDAVLPVTREIIEGGAEHTAKDLFSSQYSLSNLRRACISQLASVDVLLTPTVGTRYRLADVAKDPITTNSNLGYYTNSLNLLDMCGVAVPALPTQDGAPFGLTLVADRLQDTQLLSIAQRVEDVFSQAPEVKLPPHRTQATIDLVVCGAHMSGLPLNGQLISRGAWLLETTVTAPTYRLYALSGGPPARPGMVKDHQQGCAIEVEVWRMPAAAFASFVIGIPWPLAIGKVTLANQQELAGFTCGQEGTEGAVDISHYGGWRGYLADEPITPTNQMGAS